MLKSKIVLGLSLFSGAGLGETFLKSCGINFIVANELLEERACLYKAVYPECNVICGDIAKESVFSEVISASKNIDFLLASPPCQGMSIAGKNRTNMDMLGDYRNFLFFYVVDAMKLLRPKYVLIENVPAMLSIKLPYKGSFLSVFKILEIEFSDMYSIDCRVIDSSDYGVPQKRMRSIVKMHKHGLHWDWPEKVAKKVTVRDAIGNLPSLESGQKSKIKWHYARNHSEEHILWMKNTPTGKSAFSNKVFYPKKSCGARIKGYNSSYRRMDWDQPAPTITTRNDAISSQRNVHPGRLLKDGTYSDARVLTLYELMILHSLPKNWKLPNYAAENVVRKVIGESIPPLMLKKIVDCIL